MTSDLLLVKQLNIIHWNERDPKYGLRERTPDGEKIGMGLPLSKDELVH